MRRVVVPELMDDPDAPRELVAGALKALAVLNLLAGPHRALRRLAGPGPLLDVATGGADVPARLVRRGTIAQAVGLDRSPAVLSGARARRPGIALVGGDALALPFADRSFETAFTNHFLHHLDAEQAVTLLREMARVARRVVVVDLRRSRAVLALVWIVTRFSRNPLIRNDGPASVRRAWTPAEARALAARAGLAARTKRLLFGRFALIVE